MAIVRDHAFQVLGTDQLMADRIGQLNINRKRRASPVSRPTTPMTLYQNQDLMPHISPEVSIPIKRSRCSECNSTDVTSRQFTIRHCNAKDDDSYANPVNLDNFKVEIHDIVKKAWAHDDFDLIDASASKPSGTSMPAAGDEILNKMISNELARNQMALVPYRPLENLRTGFDLDKRDSETLKQGECGSRSRTLLTRRHSGDTSGVSTKALRRQPSMPDSQMSIDEQSALNPLEKAEPPQDVTDNAIQPALCDFLISAATAAAGSGSLKSGVIGALSSPTQTGWFFGDPPLNTALFVRNGPVATHPPLARDTLPSPCPLLPLSSPTLLSTPVSLSSFSSPTASVVPPLPSAAVAPFTPVPHTSVAPLTPIAPFIPVVPLVTVAPDPVIDDMDYDL